MIVTTEEAKKIWCLSETFERCVGNKCMAWRWVDTKHIGGYCGMAGVPLGAIGERVLNCEVRLKEALK